MKKPVPVYPLSAPCQACAGDHRLRDCTTEAAAQLLESADMPMSAYEVRQRVRAKGGAA